MVLNLTNPSWQNMIQVVGNPSSFFNVYNFLATLGQVDTSLIRIIGDSLATNRTFAVPYKTGIVPGDSMMGATRLLLQSPTTGTFIFYSPADSNVQRFEVRSVDNNNEVDPSPAVKTFWTLKSPESVCRVDAVPVPNSFAIRELTDRFLGLRFQFSSLDGNNTEDIRYSWSVDDTLSWSEWSINQVAFVTASHFKPIRTGTHVFHVRARNRWGVVSPDTFRTFTATVPAMDTPGWPKRTLIINADINGDGTRGRPSLAQVEALYNEVMDSLGRTGMYDIWRVLRSPGVYAWPSRDTLGYYTSVLILSEVQLPAIGGDANLRLLTSGPQPALKDYLTIGGKLIYSGAPDMTRAIQNYNGSSTDWATAVFHIVPVTQSPFIRSVGLDFGGVFGELGYPDVALDTNKIAADSASALRNIGLIAINFPSGLARTISWFNSKSNGPLENLPVGIRFLAPPAIPPARQTYSVVHFGFPLYYAQKPAIIQSLRKAFEDINE